MSESIPSISSTSQHPEFYQPMEVFVARPPQRRVTWIYVLAFFLTLLTTSLVGVHIQLNFQNNLSAFTISDQSIATFGTMIQSLTAFLTWALAHPHNLLIGLPFSLTLMFVLFSHEMGHYLYCRHYGVDATLPFFLPFVVPIGTLGAFIRIKSPIRSRSALFDIGIAGPIAGFVPACAALAVGLSFSRVAGPSLAPSPDIGFPLVFRLTNWLLHGNHAVPLDRLYLHPVAIAAWVGMFATALNLLPGGQLDGGHIVFSVSPRWHRTISTLTILILIPLSLYRWMGWLLWAVVLRITGMRHPIVPEYPGITRNRRWMAVLAVIMLALTFTPTPITNNSLFQLLRDFRSGH
jgi:membrane-associated protease RseP (regulator of RpoE activity)